ncbi:hypothetical protein CAP36_16660 [Chitinophagaceae bacterium IBVUCB2]|nr:hypothetical protein CAP36_16660 [Chitinophagaceae bacterium IBVUCB2]
MSASYILYSQSTQEWKELKPETYGFSEVSKFTDSRTIIYTNRNNTGFWFFQNWSGNPIFKSPDNKSIVVSSTLAEGDRPIIIDDSMAFFITSKTIIWHKPDEQKVNLLGASKGSVGNVYHAVANDSCLFMPYIYKDSCRLVAVNFGAYGKIRPTETIATMEAKNMKMNSSGNSFLINGEYLIVYMWFNAETDALLADYVYTYNLKTKAYKKIKIDFDGSSNLANINNKPVLIKSSGKAFLIDPVTNQLRPTSLAVAFAKDEKVNKVIQQKDALIILTYSNIYLSKDNGKSFKKIAPPKIPELLIEDARTNGSLVYLYISVGGDLKNRLFVKNL